ncbi:MAG: hypothetical protein HRU70_08625 [Phycisphaeraceae bacterium]|nr:MAG: hypothetical protein HRU70_08625 [Phycisphaeraceae bacterium]
MLALLGAGLLKAADLPHFADSLHRWSTIPAAWVPVIVVLVPAAEIVLAGAWLAGMHARAALHSAFVLVLLIISANVYESFMHSAPSCACFGAAFSDPQGDAGAIIPLALKALIASGLLAGVITGGSPRRARSERAAGRSVAHSPAFTLVEMLLVLVLIALLTSLLLPNAARVRQSARVSGSLAHLKSHAAVLTQYISDHRDAFPHATHPEGTSVLRCPSRGVAVPVLYFEMSERWYIPLADGYFDSDLWSRSLISPFYRRVTPEIAPVGFTTYYYPCSFLASPQYFAYETRRLPTSQFRGVSLPESHFPSQKVLIAEHFFDIPPLPGYKETDRPCGFLDGHAEVAVYRSALAMGSADGDPRVIFPLGGHFPDQQFPFLHTLHGIRGRDIE